MANSSRYFTILDQKPVSRKTQVISEPRKLNADDDSELENIIGKVTKKLNDELKTAGNESAYVEPIPEQVIPDNKRGSENSPSSPVYDPGKSGNGAKRKTGARGSNNQNNSQASGAGNGFDVKKSIANHWKYALGEFLDMSRKQFVPDPSDHKYQFARELVSLIRSESDSMSATVVREFASIFVYKGVDVAMTALKEYVKEKANFRTR